MTFRDKVKALQRRVGAADDGLIGPETLDKINAALDAATAPPKPAGSPTPASPPAATSGADIAPKQTKRRITSIAVHCSATKEGQPFTAKDIDKWHRAQGWAEIGYNAVVLLDGTIEAGRDEAKVPSHAAGHNSNSIAICYIGGVDASGKPKDTRTPVQKASLLRWLKAKRAQYPDAKILGHRDYPNVKKACPSFDVKTEYAAL